MNSKVVKFVGLACTLIGALATIGSNWVQEKQMDATIDKKLDEKLASKEN